MKTNPIEILIVFGRKLEFLYAQDKLANLSEEALASDRELELLLQFSLMLSNTIQAMGFEPLDPQSLTEADIEVLKRAIEQYLPQ